MAVGGLRERMAFLTEQALVTITSASWERAGTSALFLKD
jgi:hypothetical protein